jgi:hypothetical protein
MESTGFGLPAAVLSLGIANTRLLLLLLLPLLLQHVLLWGLSKPWRGHAGKERLESVL